MRSRIRTGLFFPMDIPSAPISSAVWRYTQLIWNDLCQLVQGFLDIQDWRRPTQHWKRHLHERPRKRRLQYDTSP